MSIELSDEPVYDVTCDVCGESQRGSIRVLQGDAWRTVPVNGDPIHLCGACEPREIEAP